MDDLLSKLKNVRTVVTHDDVFHADEVLAIATLYALKSKIDFDFGVVRTRDPKIISKADMRIDIGKINNPETLDFDHHQKGGAGVRSNGIPYASAGLIWKTFGHILAPDHDSFTYIDHKIFQPIDAEDNGMEIYKVEKKKPFTLFNVISSYNILWQDKIVHGMPITQDVAFNLATTMTKQVLKNELHLASHIPEYNKIVRSSIETQRGTPYLVLEKDIPWQPTVVRTTDMKYVIYPSDDGNWRARAVPTKIGGFTPRLAFPEEWRGLSGEDLQNRTGVDDAEFCHKAGFMAVAKSKDGAIKLAEKALAYER